MSRRAILRGEHDGEAQPGLPEPLPPGERLLWRGAPDWRVLARRGFHMPWFAFYFGVLIVWRAGSSLADGAPLASALVGTLWTLPLAALALGFIALLAWLVGRTTVYTLTDRRVVMRVGVVLTVTFNLPLRRIETARLRSTGATHGDIALLLNPQDRIGYFHLWPHARPWQFKRTEPMLRELPQAGEVARLLAEALAATAAAAEQPAQAVSHAAPAAAPRERDMAHAHSY